MKLPSQRRIYAADFKPEDREFVTALSNSQNINQEVLFNALNKNISLSDNISCTVKEIEVIVDSAGIPINVTAITRDNQLPILGAQIINVINLTNPTSYPTAQPFVAYTLNNQGKFIIQYISSLTAGNNYRLTLVIWN